MEKKEYLIKTLSRTNRKDYENYVVGAIYHKLNNINIQPVSQQYVKRSDNNYALLDLYFPQINYAIECDEKYHKNNKEKDELREINISQKLAALMQEPLTIERIDMSKSIDEINERIENIVSDIQKKYAEKGSPAWINEDPVAIAKNKKSISLKDNLSYKTMVDVLKLFGKDYKSYQHGSNRLTEDTIVWFPHLAILREDGKTISTNSSRWINLLSDDWDYIYERHDSLINRDHYGRLLNDKRIVFAKSKNCLGENAYRFIGVYELEEFEDNYQVTYKRVATELDLTEFG
jgi:hypothetical protein